MTIEQLDIWKNMSYNDLILEKDKIQRMLVTGSVTDEANSQLARYIPILDDLIEKRKLLES